MDNVFTFRDELVLDYSEFSRSFTRIAAKRKNQFAFKTYKSSGLGSKVIRAAFDTWLADKLEGVL